MTDTEPVVIATTIDASPARAFELFTADIDRWWQRDPGDEGTVQFDGASLISVSGTETRPLGKVTLWQPPTHLELAWSGPHAVEGDQVRVEFEADGERTRVTIRYLRPGMGPADATSAVLGLWWGEGLRRLRYVAGGARGAA